MSLEQVSSDQLKKIYEEFNVTEEMLQRDVMSLMEWLEKQPHLPNIKDEYWLRLFFLRCKASMERTKQMLETYYIFKARCIHLFKNRDVNSVDFKNFLKLFTAVVMPKVTPEGNRVCVFRLNNLSEGSILPTMDEFLKNIYLLHVMAFYMYGIYNKMIVISDHRNILPIINLQIKCLPRLLPFMKIFPLRYDKLYLINSSPTIDTLITLLSKFSKKIFHERIVTWKEDIKDFAKVIPKECLPDEYGGNAGKLNELSELGIEQMMSYQEWLYEEEKYVADLSKQPENQTHKHDIFGLGVTGSFRKLNID